MCPLKATTANQESWGAGDEEQNDADLKMSAGVAVLIVCSHYSTNWCAWSCWRLLAYLNSVCCLKLFHVELVAIGKKLKKMKKEFLFCACSKAGSSLLGNSVNLGRPHHSFLESWGSLSFLRDYRSGHHNLPSTITTATRPGELWSDVTLHMTVLFCYLIC